MKRVNYYTDNLKTQLKGYVKIDNHRYAAELFINDNEINLRMFNIYNNKHGVCADIKSLSSIEFRSNSHSYILFDITLNRWSFMRIDQDNQFDDYIFFAKGFLYSEGELNKNDRFSRLNIYGEGVTKWCGYTKRVDAIINGAFNDKLPSNEDCIEFENSIQSFGILGLYYSYEYGGLSGLHTLGISVKPYVGITFNETVCIDTLINSYIDLYMLMRFFIGGPLLISDVEIQKENGYRGIKIQLYLAEKKENKERRSNAMLLPYSSIYRDGSEDSFPNEVWFNYYNQDNNVKELIKKYITYSMIHDYEEKFLGFYRIVETMTKQSSSHVNQEDLSLLLTRSRKLLAKQFPGASLSDFIRAIKRANNSKHNTESCIHHFIKNLPATLVSELNIEKLNLNEICGSRNKIIHQPLYLESSEKLYKYMNAMDLLCKLALLIKLGITATEFENIDMIGLFPLSDN
ncbi:ApeA N-terminal domain 1-containing protein [Klebsiella michiganensis]|uniref:ApeA N-terminal domain 1-containing protein n=1 Tax=Klebsiella michiganensis TaxID=1134687 RepID=UPI00293168AF|nr:HEPN domain-containing protein [Klebsiella michiganensis]